MVCWAGGCKAVVVMAFRFHLHHRFHGPAIDYLELALAAFASWSVIPGPGEPVLIAAAIYAAKHGLDITSVIAVAWVAAALGGVVGWILGLKAGRALVTMRGPLRRARLRALERGQAIFTRHAVLAIYASPSWVSGILRIPTRLYFGVNAATSLAWAAVVGLGGYFAGPPIVDVVSDLGTVAEIALVVIVAASVTAEVIRRRRAAPHGGPSPNA